MLVMLMQYHANLVKKVVADIIQYGSAKRAYLGVMFGNDQMSEEQRKEKQCKRR